MNDRQLQAFLAVSEKKSMTQAAQVLYVTMPAVKKQIDALENELDVKLFKRTKQGCVLTDAGALLYHEISPMIESVNEILCRVQQLGGHKSILRVCTSAEITLPILDNFCAAFSQNYPHVEIQYISMDSRKWIAAIINGQADICLFTEKGGTLLEDAKLEYQPLNDIQQLTCIMLPTHPLARNTVITIADLVDTNVIANASSTFSGLCSNVCAQHPNLTIKERSIDRSGVFNHCQKQGLYLVVTPADQQFHPLKSIPLEYPPIHYGWAYRKAPSAIVRNLIDVSKKVIEMI